MNAAGRLVHQGILSRHLIFAQQVNRSQIMIVALIAAVLMSALSVIYVTHTTRVIYATYQRNLVEQDNLHVQRGQLLLERSTWLLQARIQEIAEKKLRMIIPNHQSIVYVHE